jgi:hypothetical protein
MKLFFDKIRKDLQHNRRVQLINSSVRIAPTSPERLILNLLDREGPKNCTEIVDRVAKQIFCDELCHGAAAIDIGLFGARLFEAEVATALKTGVGVLWTAEEIVSVKDGNSGQPG